MRLFRGLKVANITSYYIAKRTHTDIEKLEIETRQKAILDAQSKASSLLLPLGEKLGQVLEITENTGYGDYFQPEMSMARSADASSWNSKMEGDDIELEPIKIQYRVSAKFSIE